MEHIVPLFITIYPYVELLVLQSLCFQSQNRYCFTFLRVFDHLSEARMLWSTGQKYLGIIVTYTENNNVQNIYDCMLIAERVSLCYRIVRFDLHVWSKRTISTSIIIIRQYYSLVLLNSLQYLPSVCAFLRFRCSCLQGSILIYDQQYRTKNNLYGKILFCVQYLISVCYLIC